eukprot:366510-Chlamydomonas_euryale.AAC.1
MSRSHLGWWHCFCLSAWVADFGCQRCRGRLSSSSCLSVLGSPILDVSNAGPRGGGLLFLAMGPRIVDVHTLLNAPLDVGPAAMPLPGAHPSRLIHRPGAKHVCRASLLLGGSKPEALHREAAAGDSSTREGTPHELQACSSVNGRHARGPLLTTAPREGGGRGGTALLATVGPPPPPKKERAQRASRPLGPRVLFPPFVHAAHCAHARAAARVLKGIEERALLVRALLVRALLVRASLVRAMRGAVCLAVSVRALTRGSLRCATRWCCPRRGVPGCL